MKTCGLFSLSATLARMAAVAPHLEESLSKPIEGKAARKAMRLPVVDSGYSWGPTEKEDPTMNLQKVLEKEHQSLTRIIVLRQVADKLLDGRTIEVKGDRVIITPRIEIEEAAAWSPLPKPIDSYPLLTWTKKMQCPSFSLPAGAPQNGGSCPAATIAQTTTGSKNIADLEAKQKALEVAYGRPEDRPLGRDEIPLWYALSTCQSCYAEGDSYQYANNVIGLAAVYSWTQQAVANGTFVPTMIKVIEEANYFQGEAAPDGGDPDADLRHLAGTPYKRFFRWHDAGDVFSSDYMEQIKKICDHFNPRKKGKGTPTLFWLPTRVWATKGSRKWIAVNDDPDTNLVVRPSSLHVNGTAPSPARLLVSGLSSETTERDLRAAFGRFGPVADVVMMSDGAGLATMKDLRDAPRAINGMNGAMLDGRSLVVSAAVGAGNMAGSTVYVANLADAAKAAGYFDHDCPAANKQYQTNTCRKAGCRACWTKPDEVINYRLH